MVFRPFQTTGATFDFNGRRPVSDVVTGRPSSTLLTLYNRHEVTVSNIALKDKPDLQGGTVSQLIRSAGYGIRTAQELNGHAEVSTTVVYTRAHNKCSRCVALPIDFLSLLTVGFGAGKLSVDCPELADSSLSESKGVNIALKKQA